MAHKVSGAPYRTHRHSNLRLAIENLDPRILIPDERNPRTHSKKQIKQIQRGILEYGFITAVLVDSENNIIAGHARVAAAIALGMDVIPVISIEHLTEHQRTAFMLADNKLALNAAWDDRLLGEVLLSLSIADLDFDIETTGFDMAEIDLRIEGLHDIGAVDAADTLPAISAIAISRLGDLWQLGRHIILCGSALERTSYEVILGKGRAATVFTDPPYNVPIAGNVGGLGAIQHREFAMASGEMTETQFTDFLTAFTKLAAEYSVNGALHYICMDWRHLYELLAAGRLTYSELKNLCVWSKTNAGMGSLYRSQHEFISVWKHGTAPHGNNVELGRHGRNRTNVWQYASPASFGRTGEEGSLLALHPTVKPVAMVADAILDCTARGDIVLDPFLGSGTTLIAAERVGRRCHGIELDPLYVDTIIRRWQAWTGADAILAATRQTFAAVSAEREGGNV